MRFLKNSLKTLFYVLALGLLGACEEPYTPEVLDQENSFLVVSGYINSNGPTTITLSRTQSLSEEGGPVYEGNATVTVEEENGPSFSLRETSLGRYTIASLPINPAKRYRLSIRTAGKNYLSEYVEVKQTPAIDQVGWDVKNDGIQITVSSHDAQNDTRYYRWEYDETWEYNSFYYSEFEWINNRVIPRPQERNIFFCWRTVVSANINLANTVRLSQDVVSKHPLLNIPASSVKLQRRYSILVRQYAQTRESYQYWEALRKNTENIGTLFDPLPTQLTGNIRCLTAPQEPVIGFVSVTSVEQKRLFVDRTELPKDWQPYRLQGCELDSLLLRDERGINQVEQGFSSGLIPVTTLDENGSVIGYLGTSPACGDCRTQGGTTTKPDFWQ
ncbi:DUF4249 domain-containing protein [Rufibacter psychrotolerans]|uniref:DUF4249 domain-containing protein n=1 Tax=Rufibacter psychrotolerans TaxID=2812556 RepID=UPI00196805F9|nr:DUF4249 domain-containing protein [Rufibacter sp. SYSU D00308]